jgi:hypothetical protein
MDTSKFGTDPHTLHRAGGIETSEAAAYSIDSAGLEERVYQTVRGFGVLGCTQDDVLAKHPGAPYSSITARFSSLLRKNLIVDTGVRRPGQSGRKQRVVYVPPASGDLPGI